MDWLNYHHLFYFHAVAREGSLTSAAKSMRLAPATVSAQVKALEEALGHPLFEREGRRLVLTEQGRVVQRYADDIFDLGREMRQSLEGRASRRGVRLRVGISDVLPKLLAHRILAPALAMPDGVHLDLRESTTDHLLAELARHNLDLVLADSPAPSSARSRGFNHLLGETGTSFFATATLAKKIRPDFPARLDGAPMLLPRWTSTLRPMLDHWFERQKVAPKVIAEFDDSALMKVFGQRGAGVFPGPTILEKEITTQYEVVAVGRAPAVKERFYAITMERRIRHPVAITIAEAAASRLFGDDGESS